MKRGHKRGFTVVELLIVIVVIAVLATVISVMYNSAQAQSRDLKVRDAASKVADAIQLFAIREGHFPKGGWGSTLAIGGNTECTDGANGWLATGYSCTVADTLIASGYIQSSLIDDLPPNTLFAQPNRQAMMVYIHGANKAMVYYSLENPTASDTAQFNRELTNCGMNPAGVIGPRDSYGMKNGICIDY